jgi:hypothetical protein
VRINFLVFFGGLECVGLSLSFAYVAYLWFFLWVSWFEPRELFVTSNKQVCYTNLANHPWKFECCDEVYFHMQRSKSFAHRLWMWIRTRIILQESLSAETTICSFPFIYSIWLASRSKEPKENQLETKWSEALQCTVCSLSLPSTKHSCTSVRRRNSNYTHSPNNSNRLPQRKWTYMYCTINNSGRETQRVKRKQKIWGKFSHKCLSLEGIGCNVIGKVFSFVRNTRYLVNFWSAWTSWKTCIIMSSFSTTLMCSFSSWMGTVCHDSPAT